MNLLPLDNPQCLEISRELGVLFAQYNSNEPIDESKLRLQALKDKVDSADAKSTIEAVFEIMALNMPLRFDQLKQDVETIRYYKDLRQKNAATEEARIAAQKERLASLRSQLTALQSKS